MHHASVFHLHGELDDEAALGGGCQELGKRGVIEFVVVVVRMEANAGHVVSFLATVELRLPVADERTDRAEGDELRFRISTAGRASSGTQSGASCCEPFVD